MREINLLPPEAFQRLSARRTRARFIVVGVLYVVMLLLLTLLWQGRVSSAENVVTIQQVQNDSLQTQVNSLIDSQALEDDYNADRRLIEEALAVDMSWGRLLNDLARLIPDRVWLESFSGAVSDGAEIEEALGTVTVAGIGFTYPDVSAWLRSLDSDRFPGVEGTWVQTVSESLIGVADVVNFASTTSLTEAAFSNRIAERVPLVAP